MATPFPFSADWSTPIVERFDWLTDLLPSANDTEQRVRLREGARRGVEYSLALLGNTERVLCENLLRAGGGGYFEVPFWPDAVQLDTAAAAAGLVLSVGEDLSGFNFVAGGYVQIVDGLRAAMLSIDDVDAEAGEISLVDPLAAGWPAGARVLPAGFARLQDRSNVVRYRSDAAAVSTLRFDFDGEWLWPAAEEDATYRSYSVLEQQTNWSNEPEADHSRSLAELDGSVGRRLVSDLTGIQRVAKGHSWLLGGREEIAAFRSFLAARAGRLVPFWLPSLQDDVHLVAPAASGATTLQVANLGRWRLDGSPAAIGRRDLRVVLVDGSVLYRRVTAAEQISADVEQLTLDSALGVAVTPTSVLQASYMRLVRLASDSVEIVYQTDRLAECSVGLASVRDVL